MRTRRIALAVTLLAALPLLASPRDFSYVYVRGGRTQRVTASNVEVENVGRIAKRYAGSFVWAEIDGEEHVIRDAATLAEIERVFAPLDAMSPDIDALHAKMEPLEREEQQLEDKIDELEEQLDDDDDLSATEERRLESKMRELQRDMRTLERRMRDLEREEQRLEREQDRRENAAERELERIIERAVGR